ncbi:hypothetical protein VNI00_015688 [Paramarasmius palmivorus]|uniref:F-box domain-containing protein n=1 Tax=Paramarasmius palmivorus TaxID=297713 RepID=A0AAW0BJE5_9AGAR
MPKNQSGSPQCIKCKIKIIPTPNYASLSPFILRTNIAPTKTEIAQTKAILEEEEEELQRCDEEIEYARQALERLTARRDVLRRNLVERRSWLAPIRRLPVEILDMIFAEVPNTSLNIGGLRTSERSRFGVEAVSLRLTHVSCHWRTIVSAKCSMWSTIDWSCWIRAMKKDWTPLLNIYLKNAAREPLRIYIGQVPGYYSDPDLITVEDWKGTHDLHFLQTLARQFPRCVELTIDHRDIQSTVLHYALRTVKFEDNAAFPRLRCLTYRGNGQTYVDSNGVAIEDRFWNAIRRAPMLEHMLLSKIPYLTRMDAFHSDFPPWDQLTTLFILVLDSYADFHAFIAHCPRLEDLTIDSPVEWDDGPAWDDVTEPVVLSHLRSLCFESENPQRCHKMLASISLPSLKKLDIGFGGQDPSDKDSIRQVLQSLFFMLKRSSCALTCMKLVLRQWILGASSMAWFSDILGQSTSLETLVLCLDYEVEDCVDLVMHEIPAQLCTLLSLSNHHTQVFLPQLRALQIEALWDDPNHPLNMDTFGDILDVIEERSQSACS